MQQNDYYMQIAETVKLRSGCLRRQVGAVYVLNDGIVATGFNQAASGMIHCNTKLGNGKLQGCTIVNGHCIRAIHAEVNGILRAAKIGSSLQGCCLYTTTFPCLSCLKAIHNVGVAQVFYKEAYSYEKNEMELFYELCKHVRLIQI